MAFHACTPVCLFVSLFVLFQSFSTLDANDVGHRENNANKRVVGSELQVRFEGAPPVSRLPQVLVRTGPDVDLRYKQSCCSFHLSELPSEERHIQCR